MRFTGAVLGTAQAINRRSCARRRAQASARPGASARLVPRLSRSSAVMIGPSASRPPLLARHDRHAPRRTPAGLSASRRRPNVKLFARAHVSRMSTSGPRAATRPRMSASGLTRVSTRCRMSGARVSTRSGRQPRARRVDAFTPDVNPRVVNSSFDGPCDRGNACLTLVWRRTDSQDPMDHRTLTQ